MLAKELHDVAPGVIAGLMPRSFSGMKVGLASVRDEQKGDQNVAMDSVPARRHSDKTGFFDLWKAAALPWLMSVGDGEH